MGSQLSSNFHSQVNCFLETIIRGENSLVQNFQLFLLFSASFCHFYPISHCFSFYFVCGLSRLLIIFEPFVIFVFAFYQANHLVGLKRKYLKLSFNSVTDLMKAKRDVMPAIRKNKEREKSNNAYTSMLTR